MQLSVKNIYLLIIVFLLATNVAVIITFRNHLRSEKPNIEDKIEVPNSRLGRFFREELELNSVQHQKFRGFRQHYHQTTNKLLGDMQVIRNTILHELNNRNPNRKKLDKLAHKIGEMHTELKGLTYDYYLNMQGVLNESQQDKMVNIFQSMLTEEGFAKTPHHGLVPPNGNVQGHHPVENDTCDHHSHEIDDFEKFEN